ncbi:hypothetical protein HOP62_05095 [Halomonas sp. MCCC 1A17488]|uniref:hypothetical protein n=1 Tax=unclassified Halomonas TaxID=2609666 RepID=UPI0018D1FFE2|nr:MULTISPECIES: hypothetical protein [unclassified Halomonas]MCE8015451.1 hypothetical protein [Halomonas sp. MCCC 1A17488]MCG3238784.1 hypothetical protein [Halomonas sp. MCCC 1A17488]QPP51250.1 hypothetical protein I4484_09305 [Halomonas sp. SS10-MC5]
MTTLRFSTIWDLPLAARREADEPPTAPTAERFLTIWDSPRLTTSTKGKRPPRKLAKFYL